MAVGDTNRHIGRMKAKTAIREVPANDAAGRVDTIDWPQAERDLDAQGCAVLKSLLTPDECRALAALYPDDAIFRSRIVMGRHGFGRGEYKYFSYPLPDLIAQLRPALYARLKGVANRWNEAMGIDIRYPDRHEAFLRRCHDDGPDPADATVCCNMRPAISTACIRTSMANTCFRCRSRSCCRNPAAISKVASSC